MENEPINLDLEPDTKVRITFFDNMVIRGLIVRSQPPDAIIVKVVNDRSDAEAEYELTRSEIYGLEVMNGEVVETDTSGVEENE